MATCEHKKRIRAITAAPKIVALARYPVKGLAGIAMTKVALAAGEGVPLGRAYAIEHGAQRFDAENPKWLHKTHFLQLMQHERLAGLGLDFGEASHVLRLFRGSRQIARSALKTKLGRQMMEQSLAAYMKAGPRVARVIQIEGRGASA